jgi:hypothetical protein
MLTRFKAPGAPPLTSTATFARLLRALCNPWGLVALIAWAVWFVAPQSWWDTDLWYVFVGLFTLVYCDAVGNRFRRGGRSGTPRR